MPSSIKSNQEIRDYYPRSFIQAVDISEDSRTLVAVSNHDGTVNPMLYRPLQNFEPMHFAAIAYTPRYPRTVSTCVQQVVMEPQNYGITAFAEFDWV